MLNKYSVTLSSTAVMYDTRRQQGSYDDITKKVGRKSGTMEKPRERRGNTHRRS